MLKLWSDYGFPMGRYPFLASPPQEEDAQTSAPSIVADGLFFKYSARFNEPQNKVFIAKSTHKHLLQHYSPIYLPHLRVGRDLISI